MPAEPRAPKEDRQLIARRCQTAANLFIFRFPESYFYDASTKQDSITI